MTTHGIGIQQHSQSVPHASQLTHPVFGAVGLTMEEIELLEGDGKTALVGSWTVEEHIMPVQGKDLYEVPYWANEVALDQSVDLTAGHRIQRAYQSGPGLK